MISNERTWPSQRRPYRPPYRQPYAPQPPRPYVQEDTLKSGHIQIERKSFLLTLKENPRGRFLRISEEVAGKRNGIIVPATGLSEFKRLLDEMVQASNELPAAGEPMPPEMQAPEPPAPVPTATLTPVPEPATAKPARKPMSAATRAKIAAAAVARWAKVKATGKKS
jgi:hypothetical protein